MADECDFATDLQLRAAEAFAAKRLNSIALVYPAASAEVCDCGAPIPEARRKAVPGVWLCTFCQAKAERREVRHGRP